MAVRAARHKDMVSAFGFLGANRTFHQGIFMRIRHQHGDTVGMKQRLIEHLSARMRQGLKGEDQKRLSGHEFIT